MYAIVRAGGRQEKVSLGDTIVVDHLEGQVGDTVSLAPVLLVDGSAVTSDAAELANVPVTAEILGAARGPKIHILRFKNKTGYRRRQGHRSHLTSLRVTGIGKQKWEKPATKKADAPAEKKAAPAKAAKAAKDIKTTEAAE